MAIAKKPTQTPKPIAKKTVAKMPSSGPMAKVAKPKVSPSPTPKFLMPTIADYRKSAAYKSGGMSYKEYVDTSKQVYDAKYGKKR